MQRNIEAALELAAQPASTIPAPEPSTPAPPVFTTQEIDAAVRDRIDRSLRAAVGPVVLADGTALTDPSDIRIEAVACEAGGTAATAQLEIRTGDNVMSEEAILTAWVTDGFARDRAAGTNLLSGDEANATLRASLRGTIDNVLRLTIESRCAVG